MDIMGGLMAGANYGTGYFQGRQQATNEGFQNALNGLIVQKAQNQANQERMLQDKMMQLFQPTVTNPLNGQPLSGAPAGNQAPPAPDPQELASKLMQGAKYALSIGDIEQGNQLATNAINLTSAVGRQQQMAAATQEAELQRKIKSHALVAQTLGAAQNEQQFDNAKLAILSDPSTSPEEAQNIARLQYSPDTVRQIRLSGMNSAQQAQSQLAQLRQTEQERHNQQLEQADAIRNQIAQRRLQAQEQHWKDMGKVGAVGKAPSKTEIATATPVVVSALYPDGNYDPQDMGLRQTINDVASRAKQIVSNNRAVTYPEAVQMALGQMQKSGAIQVKPAETWHLTQPSTWGTSTTPAKVETLGNSQENPIPLKGKSKADLIPGKWYELNGKVEQYVPQQ